MILTCILDVLDIFSFEIPTIFCTREATFPYTFHMPRLSTLNFVFFILDMSWATQLNLGQSVVLFPSHGVICAR